MTNPRIKKTLQKIEICKKNESFNEALLLNYHLNTSLIIYMLNRSVTGYSSENKKMKTIAKEFLKEITINAKLKSIMNKKNFKGVKVWLDNMDGYFKILKLKQPANTRQLLTETQNIFALLNISVNKMISNKTA